MESESVIKVLFFARIRDEIGVSELDLTLADHVADVGSVLAQLKSQGVSYERVLSAPDLQVAVNQEMAAAQTEVRDGDEIALYPPVTGG